MSSARFMRKWVLVFTVVLLVAVGSAGTSHAYGQVVGRYQMSLDVTSPRDGESYRAGDTVHVAARSSGFTGLKVTVKNQATGAEEELKVKLVRSEGTDTLAPKVWDAPWSTEGKKPGQYLITMRAVFGNTVSSTMKTVNVSVIQPSGAVKTAEVPNVVGMTEYEAVTTLDKAGFKINPAHYVFTPKQETWGRVVGQSVRAGTKATQPITLTVGQR